MLGDAPMLRHGRTAVIPPADPESRGSCCSDSLSRRFGPPIAQSELRVKFCCVLLTPLAVPVPLPEREAPQWSSHERLMQAEGGMVRAVMPLFDSATPAETDPTSQCSICMDSYQDPMVLPCSHMFCKECLKEYDRKKGDGKCPICRSSTQTEVELPSLTESEAPTIRTSPQRPTTVWHHHFNTTASTPVQLTDVHTALEGTEMQQEDGRNNDVNNTHPDTVVDIQPVVASMEGTGQIERTVGFPSSSLSSSSWVPGSSGLVEIDGRRYMDGRVVRLYWVGPCHHIFRFHAGGYGAGGLVM